MQPYIDFRTLIPSKPKDSRNPLTFSSNIGLTGSGTVSPSGIGRSGLTSSGMVSKYGGASPGRGEKRGQCMECENCNVWREPVSEGVTCEFCDHPRGSHEVVPVSGIDFGAICSHPNCINKVNSPKDQFCQSPSFHYSSNTIKFYDKNDKYYYFTNFYATTITIDGKDWKTCEHYFQGMKFQHISIHTAIQQMTTDELKDIVDWKIPPQYSPKSNESISFPTPLHEEAARRFPTNPRLSEVIRASSEPRYAFEFARKWSKFIRSDWNDVKLEIMFNGLKHKFQRDYLKDQLVNTYSMVLIEHTKNDSFWADGGDGTGKNWLGKLLMILRGQLKKY